MKKAFLYLALVNILDMCATLSGLRLGFIQELNPIMNTLYEVNPFLFVAVKLLISFILVGLVIKVPLMMTTFLKWVTSAACILYTLTLGLHTLWIYDAVR
ncbi:DUF5658 family protein [Metabacillus sp. RGM 3146]|uniref:DUF5658 family protein n=1 Tax=Metabacillus sp. RGM 3146 TaxID=3401092 RepID=UPI003B9ADAE1